MNIVMIGSGNVATHLALALSKRHQVVQVFSQNLPHAQRLAKQVSAQPIDQFNQVQAADLYIVAVKDSAIVTVAQQLRPYINHAVVVHTSGSTDIQVLQAASNHYGVFYPLQTFSLAKAVDFTQVPLLLESSDTSVHEKLTELAQGLSQNIYYYSSAQRRSLHLGAVIACNFSNYLYTLAKQFLDREQVDFNLLTPLILETAQKMIEHAPEAVQTGPAIRGDTAILNQHTEMLAGQPELQQLYQYFSEQIMRHYHD